MSQSVTEVYWDALVHPIFQNRPLYLAATRQGLCLITQPHEPFETLQLWIGKKIPGAKLVHDPGRMAEYTHQLREYFDGNRTSFAFPFDLRGTAFQVSVWQTLTRIPYGHIQSYSEIAEAVGKPKAVRAVGAANGANPIPFVIPCHRVIGKSSALTGYRGGLQVKGELLRLEGFDEYTNKGHSRFQF
ncbi:methylated-DNA--[protein]-cysteine S-methyltransferase [Paenibacillus arenilitoris]|uniref:Methylated-DNA--protein-cysteine methyltransferase n=1 Tax=Paenibacillus arenilitoris TaxID=2772299 RepID=A0A927H570_9BACL|nr:methylated-DNA--[protein]-cysteine S-methyltransferase [Paenibacillus arenilitoris]MBD2869176.1 methylated-DNA--[protein]-cysteine S-methyltransferase [Paenibacillus arenilitoris]